jgi:hypothetical protein
VLSDSVLRQALSFRIARQYKPPARRTLRVMSSKRWFVNELAYSKVWSYRLIATCGNALIVEMQNRQNVSVSLSRKTLLKTQ